MASASRDQRRILLGDGDEEDVYSISMLATAYWLDGRWEEAEQLEMQVMETRKTKLGEDHPDRLSSMANLAFTCKSSGHNAQAIDLLRNCLAKQRQKLGLDHTLTLSTSRTLLAWETDSLKISSYSSFRNQLDLSYIRLDSRKINPEYTRFYWISF
jgi:hypothetical protein